MLSLGKHFFQEQESEFLIIAIIMINVSKIFFTNTLLEHTAWEGYSIALFSFAGSGVMIQPLLSFKFF